MSKFNADCLRRDYLDYKDGVLSRKEMANYLRYHFPEFKIYRSDFTWTASILGWTLWFYLGPKILNAIIDYIK